MCLHLLYKLIIHLIPASSWEKQYNILKLLTVQIYGATITVNKIGQIPRKGYVRDIRVQEGT